MTGNLKGPSKEYEVSDFKKLENSNLLRCYSVNTANIIEHRCDNLKSCSKIPVLL